MQKLEPRKIITLGTGEKYLVISEAELEGKSYYYITEVNEMETETKEKALQGANASLGENMLFGADSDEKDTSFINQLYDEIASVLGADDALHGTVFELYGHII